MTNEEIRIAVAEEMGWTDCHLCKSCSCGEIVGTTPDKNFIATTPNCPASLDACTEFEKTLMQGEEVKYVTQLRALLSKSNLRWLNDGEACYRATPLQRCEAFLRLRNRWKD